MGIFSSDSSTAGKDGCPLPSGNESLKIHGDAHQPMMYIAAVSAILLLISAVGLSLLHLTRYRAPKEQRQIVRICWVPVVFAVVSWAEIYDYSAAVYLDPIGQWYEAICVCAMYLLFIQFAVPRGTFGDNMFLAMANAADNQQPDTNSGWPRLSWILVFQLPVTATISLIVTEATEAANVYCPWSLKPKFGHFWAQVILSVGLVLAVVNVIKFYGRTKSLMKPHRALAKLVGFKLIVGLIFIQRWIFSILLTKGDLHNSKHFSFGDYLYGLPNVLIAVEMVLFSLFFWFAYSPAEYSAARRHEQSMNLFAAAGHAINPTDIVVGILRNFVLVGAPDRSEQTAPSYYASVENGYAYGGRYPDELNGEVDTSYNSPHRARNDEHNTSAERYLAKESHSSEPPPERY